MWKAARSPFTIPCITFTFILSSIILKNGFSYLEYSSACDFEKKAVECR
jgi:hypothetical protein